MWAMILCGDGLYLLVVVAIGTEYGPECIWCYIEGIIDFFGLFWCFFYMNIYPLSLIGYWYLSGLYSTFIYVCLFILGYYCVWWLFWFIRVLCVWVDTCLYVCWCVFLLFLWVVMQLYPLFWCRLYFWVTVDLLLYLLFILWLLVNYYSNDIDNTTKK
jgi:hypothetical protein